MQTLNVHFLSWGCSLEHVVWMQTADLVALLDQCIACWGSNCNVFAPIFFYFHVGFCLAVRANEQRGYDEQTCPHRNIAASKIRVCNQTSDSSIDSKLIHILQGKEVHFCAYETMNEKDGKRIVVQTNRHAKNRKENKRDVAFFNRKKCHSITQKTLSL